MRRFDRDASGAFERGARDKCSTLRDHVECDGHRPPLQKRRSGASAPRKPIVDVCSKAGQHAVHVKSITYTAARENLASTINRVCEDEAPIVITRNRDQAVVMMSLAEYESLQETAYLLRSPANARRLLKSIESLESGKGIRKKLKLKP